jgi:hypothetical protein
MMRLIARGSKTVDRLLKAAFGCLLMLVVPWHFFRIPTLLESVAATLEISTHALIIRDCVHELLARFVPGYAEPGAQILLVVSLSSLLAMSAIRVFRPAIEKVNPAPSAAAFQAPPSNQPIPERRRIATEGEHFNFILEWAATCKEGESLQVLVPLKLVHGSLTPAPEFYLSELSRLAQSRKINVEYLFLVKPEVVTGIGKRNLRAFFRQYESAALMRVTYLTAVTMDRFRFKACDHVFALLGKNLGLSHRRDESGAFVAGRVLTEKRRQLSEKVYRTYRIASEKVSDFLERI